MTYRKDIPVHRLLPKAQDLPSDKESGDSSPHPLVLEVLDGFLFLLPGPSSRCQRIHHILQIRAIYI